MLGEYVACHRKRLLAMASVRGLEQDAEDILQEACLAASRYISKWDPRYDIGPWFCRIVSNARHHWCVRRRLPTESLDLLLESGTEPVAPATDIVESVYLGQVLAELSPLQREAVMLRHFDALGKPEIAARCRVPGSTVKWRLSAGLNKAREVVGDAYRL